MIVIIPFIENNIDIFIYLILLETAGDSQIDIYFVLYRHYSHSYTCISTFTFPFITLGSLIRFCKIIRACDVLSPSMKLSSLHYKKCYGTAGVDYIKLKNDVTY